MINLHTIFEVSMLTLYKDMKHTVVLLLFWNLSGTIRVSRYQKGKNQEG